MTLFLGIGLVCSLVLLVVFFNLFKGQKRKKAVYQNKYVFKYQDIDYYRDVPFAGDLNYFFYVALVSRTIKPKDKPYLIMAYILKWAKAGYVVIESQGQEMTVDLSREIPCKDQYEQELISFLLEAAGPNKLLESKELQTYLNNQGNYQRLLEWFDRIMEDGDQKAQLSGALEYRIHKKWFFDDMDLIYTAIFVEEAKQVIGFKKFLEEFSLIEEKKVIEVALWEDYLIYASILGCAKTVQQQIGQVCPQFSQVSVLDENYTVAAIGLLVVVLLSSQILEGEQGWQGGHRF